jgi:hypothetical protein
MLEDVLEDVLDVLVVLSLFLPKIILEIPVLIKCALAIVAILEITPPELLIGCVIGCVIGCTVGRTVGCAIGRTLGLELELELRELLPIYI